MLRTVTEQGEGNRVTGQGGVPVLMGDLKTQVTFGPRPAASVGAGCVALWGSHYVALWGRMGQVRPGRSKGLQVGDPGTFKKEWGASVAGAE